MGIKGKHELRGRLPVKWRRKGRRWEEERHRRDRVGDERQGYISWNGVEG